VVQCVAVCCNAVQCVAVSCSELQCKLKRPGHIQELTNVLLQRVAVCSSVAVCYSVLQCVAMWCSVLQCVAVRCSVLQCLATNEYALCTIGFHIKCVWQKCSIFVSYVLQCVAVCGTVQCLFALQMLIRP